MTTPEVDVNRVVHLVGMPPLLVCAPLVFTANGKSPIKDGAVLVNDRRVSFVGPAIDAPHPDGLQVLEFPDCTLLPGLIDAHVHVLGNTTWDEHWQFLHRFPRIDAIRAAIDASFMLDAGFTTLRDVGVPGPAAVLKAAVRLGVIEAPRMVISIAALSQTGGHADSLAYPLEWSRRISPFVIDGGPKGMMVDGVDECRRAVRDLVRQGADIIKIFLEHSLWEDLPETVPPVEFSDEELGAIMDEAHRRGLMVAAHAESLPATKRAVAFGADTVEHGARLVDETVLREMAQRGTILVPTLTVAALIGAEGAKWGFSPEESRGSAAQVAQRQDVAAAAHRLGVPIAVGTSAGYIGRGQNALEFVLFVEAGMTPAEAIEAGTRISARACGLERELGTLEEGKLADVIVVRGNPLDDIRLLLERPIRIFTTARSMVP